ncbi:DUF4493 domain-containing protein [Flammeovirga yaeyamensis]|uniref:DUF4493 domain-containing protein n=1 Tax=Flammeovirga yaeyamensis TaxID=367791 RepID=A0AAX1NFK4_9BACT|nr:DUF4493 domain-containing protein [Flammeovirga yaeyamensis]MBB3697069.1 hypothetical protein [Flammeovirga yaeyamensis]NMF33731.1 DUF4493 domain-containing protein [Flammeovirga yaeyamensis]QWG05003.1 DUF4493 domain-containing protein [Flammeovirga yaeyamensis]
MKHWNRNIIAALIGLLIISCTTSEDEAEKVATGQLVLHTSSNQRTSESADDYGVIIKNTEGETVLSFEKLSDAPESISLAVGEYQVQIFNQEEMPFITFDAPYYYGENDFIIESGKTTDVSVTCTLKHMLLTIVFDDKVKNDAKSYATEIHTAHDKVTIDASTSNKVYVERSAIVLETTIEEMYGTILSSKQVLSGLEEKTEYTINISY